MGRLVAPRGSPVVWHVHSSVATGISIAVGGGSRDTGRMLVKDIEGARAALREGRAGDLLGLTECGWLDAKAGVYLLDDPARLWSWLRTPPRSRIPEPAG